MANLLGGEETLDNGLAGGQVTRVNYRPILGREVAAMKCEGCGAELVAGAKTCPACGRSVGFGQRAEAETVHVAEKTGEAAEKVGRGLVGGIKGFASGAKKGFKGSDKEKKE
jgi:hypothetical protein